MVISSIDSDISFPDTDEYTKKEDSLLKKEPSKMGYSGIDTLSSYLLFATGSALDLFRETPLFGISLRKKKKQFAYQEVIPEEMPSTRPSNVSQMITQQIVHTQAINTAPTSNDNNPITSPRNLLLEYENIPGCQNAACFVEDRRKIKEIIEGMDQMRSWSSFLSPGNGIRLKTLGDQIEHIHPFKFLGEIFSNPHLRRKACDFCRSSSFLKEQFSKGVRRRMEQKANENMLEPYISAFAAKIPVNENDIRPFIQSRNWDGLIDFLLHHNYSQ